jgi:hypothetical protein
MISTRSEMTTTKTFLNISNSKETIVKPLKTSRERGAMENVFKKARKT